MCCEGCCEDCLDESVVRSQGQYLQGSETSNQQTPSPFSMPSNRPESGVKQQDQPEADLMEFPFFPAEVKPNVKTFFQGVVERRSQRLVV